MLAVINKSKGTVLADKAELARSFFQRLKGLMFRKKIDSGFGMIFYHCSSIHTFFMRFDIDVIFLDKTNRIVKLYKRFSPCKISSIVLNSYVTIEIPAGVIEKTSTQLGDILEIKHASV